MKSLGILSVFVILKVIESSTDSSWGYKSTNNVKGPSEWKDISSTCGGGRQSPIDIVSEGAIYSKDLHTIGIKKTDNFTNPSTLEKHKASIYLKFNNNWKITFGGETCLKPDAIHWHWGSKSTVGSEHTVNRKPYPIEAHLVSYNCANYSSLNEAKSSPEGLYVIGIFYKIGPKNALIDKFIPEMRNMSSLNISSYNISEISVEEILPKNLEKYYQYDGSLTTPPCTENVRWTILIEELTIDESQLEVFRQFEFELPNAGRMMDNFRPVIPNPDNKRPIYSSFKTGINLKFNVKVLFGTLCAVFTGLLIR